MLSEVIKYVKTCPKCQGRKGALKAQASLQEFPEISELLDRVGADLIDLHCSLSGNRYVLVLVDHLSRYTTLIAIPQKDSRTVARAFFNRFVTVFGSPKVLVSDRGQEFNGDIFREVCLLNRHNVAYGEDYPSEVLNKKRNAWRVAAEASREARGRYAHYYDRNVQPLKLKEGSLVLRINEAAPTNQSRRLTPRWRGPYRVTKKDGPVNVVIMGVFEDQVERTVHINKLKIYHAREELELPSASLIPDPSELTGNSSYESDGENDPLSSLVSSQMHSRHPMVTRSRTVQ
ncbi:uncharacterized protein [Procambarus clarkii]|uniref:uncharacterized protein n=1 Tax=Procambarus clarkii TaxID=6728 RepID=UPI003742B5EC